MYTHVWPYGPDCEDPSVCLRPTKSDFEWTIGQVYVTRSTRDESENALSFLEVEDVEISCCHFDNSSSSVLCKIKSKPLFIAPFDRDLNEKCFDMRIRPAPEEMWGAEYLKFIRWLEYDEQPYIKLTFITPHPLFSLRNLVGLMQSYRSITRTLLPGL
jgi:hypothetical protein